MPLGNSRKPSQPVAAFAAEGLDLLPVLGAGDDGTQGDDDDVLQVMQAAVGRRGSFSLAKYLGIDRSGCWA